MYGVLFYFGEASKKKIFDETESTNLIKAISEARYSLGKLHEEFIIHERILNENVKKIKNLIEFLLGKFTNRRLIARNKEKKNGRKQQKISQSLKYKEKILFSYRKPRSSLLMKKKKKQKLLLKAICKKISNQLKAGKEFQ